MSDKAYTDADLRAEAARQLALHSADRDFMGIGERMGWASIPSRRPDADGSGGASWDDLAPHEFDAARDKIDTLLTNAADVSEWAVNLGADGLEPDGRALNPDAGVRIHFAFGPTVPDDVKRAWIDGIHHAIREGL